MLQVSVVRMDLILEEKYFLFKVLKAEDSLIKNFKLRIVGVEGVEYR